MGDGGRPLVNVVGGRVALGPLQREMGPLFAVWMNDFATQRSAGFPPSPEPWPAERMGRWLDGVLGDGQRVWFAIYETAAWRMVGHANLRDIDHEHGTAEFGITIGDPADRGKGYGSEATRLLLGYAFTTLGLSNVLLDVLAFNRAGIRAYEKAGFKEIGRRREAFVDGDRVWDVVFMDCVAGEFGSA
jgi:diamine N-acetyltransferase